MDSELMLILMLQTENLGSKVSDMTKHIQLNLGESKDVRRQVQIWAICISKVNKMSPGSLWATINRIINKNLDSKVSDTTKHI